MFVSGMGECVSEKLYDWITIDVKVDTLGCDLGENVTNLRFDLGEENSVSETEKVLVMLWMLNS